MFVCVIIFKFSFKMVEANSRIKFIKSGLSTNKKLNSMTLLVKEFVDVCLLIF